MTRGCTSRPTSSVAQVRRASCTVMSRTPEASQRAVNFRFKVRGSTGVPYRPVNTRCGPSGSPAWMWIPFDPNVPGFAVVLPVIVALIVAEPSRAPNGCASFGSH
jgi:hypothetical protein